MKENFERLYKDAYHRALVAVADGALDKKFVTEIFEGEEYLDEFEVELKNFIQACGVEFKNPHKHEIAALIRCEAAKLRRIWRDEENAESGCEFNYDKFISDLANAIPKREIGWKPSVEQLKVMKEAVLYFGDSWVSHKHQVLQSLYEDLMKV